MLRGSEEAKWAAVNMVLLLFAQVLKTNQCQSDVLCQKTSLASGGVKASASPNKAFSRGATRILVCRSCWDSLNDSYWWLWITRKGKTFFWAKVGIMFFQMICSWYRWWEIPVESNIPQVGLALVTLVTSLLWHGAYSCWWPCATGPAQLFLSSLDAIITKSIFLNNLSWYLQVWGERKVTASLSQQNSPKIVYLWLSQPLARWCPCWDGGETLMQLRKKPQVGSSPGALSKHQQQSQSRRSLGVCFVSWCLLIVLMAWEPSPGLAFLRLSFLAGRF